MLAGFSFWYKKGSNAKKESFEARHCLGTERE
jgi:hypothetical protein